MAIEQVRSFIEEQFPDSLLAIKHSFGDNQQLDRDIQYQYKHNKFPSTMTCNTQIDREGVEPCLQLSRFTPIKYSTQDWEKKKPDLETLFMKEGYTQQRVLEEIALQDFFPSLHAFKRKCLKWGWGTYRNSGSRKRSHKPQNKSQNGPETNLSSPTTTETVDNTSLSQSSPYTIASKSPMALPFSLPSPQIPPKFSDSRYHLIYQALVGNVEQLYKHYLPTWKVHNNNAVEEDEHDDLLVGINSSLRSLEESENSFAHHGIHKAFHTLRKVVVGTKKSGHCGFFSLPAILQGYLRFREHNEPIMAKCFILHAIRHAKQKFKAKHPFVRVLVNLQHIRRIQELQEYQAIREAQNVQYLEDLMQANFEELKVIIYAAYFTCIEVTKQRLGAQNISYLQLWGDFVVYGDNSSASDALDVIQQAVRTCEEDNSECDDHTMTLLGMKLYVQQSIPSWTKEAEATALDMVRRLDSRVRKTGIDLEGDMLIIWKDLRHTLGNFQHARKEYAVAIWYLEVYLEKGVEDDRDIFALKLLEEWYSDWGDDAKALKVRERRIYEEKRQTTGVLVDAFSNEFLYDASDKGTWEYGSENGGRLSNESTVVGEVEPQNVLDAETCKVLDDGMAEVDLSH